MTITDVGYTLVTADSAGDLGATYGLNPYMFHEHVEPGTGLSWDQINSPGSWDCDQHVILLSGIAGYGEYDSSAVWHRANHEWLIANYGRWLITVGRSTHDGLSLALKVGSVVPTELIDVLRAAHEDYPVIDEDGMWEIEEQLRDEAFEGWVIADLRTDLLLPFGGEASELAWQRIEEIEDSELRYLFDEAESDLDIRGYAETSCSWVWDRSDWSALVAHVLGNLTMEW